MVKRILVGVCDPQYTASVSAYAQELAHRFGAEVTAMSVTDMKRLKDVGPVAIGAGTFTQELVQERIENNAAAIRQSLELLVQQLAEAKVPCRVVAEDGDPYEQLIHASRYHDLMIFGLRGLLEHGVTEEPPDELINLIESGVRPILATGPEYREVRRVLISYNGSVESAWAMKHFANMKLWPTAQIKVVHFGKGVSEGPGMLAEARGYLHDFGFSVEEEAIDDSPRTGLLKQATDWNADLIVIGNSAKSLLLRRVFGETALRTIRESHLPLFLSQ